MHQFGRSILRRDEIYDYLKTVDLKPGMDFPELTMFETHFNKDGSERFVSENGKPAPNIRSNADLIQISFSRKTSIGVPNSIFINRDFIVKTVAYFENEGLHRLNGPALMDQQYFSVSYSYAIHNERFEIGYQDTFPKDYLNALRNYLSPEEYKKAIISMVKNNYNMIEDEDED